MMKTSKFIHNEAKPMEQTFPLRKDMFCKLKPGDCTDIRFRGEDINLQPDNDDVFKLYFTGEVDIPWEYRCEPKYPVLYRRICESLIEKDGAYCLRVKAERALPRMAFFRTEGIPATAKKLTFSCTVEGEIQEGNCRFEIEVYYRNGRPRFAYDMDGEIFKAIPVNGSTVINTVIPIEQEIDFVLVGLRLDDFKGDLVFTSPTLTDQNGNQYIEPFDMKPRDMVHKKWVGINLSKIEWPVFTVTLNGSVIHDGASFERIHRWPSHEFVLPKELIRSGDNDLRIQYRADYLEPLDYTLRDISILSSPTEQGIIAFEKYATKEFGVLIKLKKESTVSCCTSCSAIMPVIAEQTLTKGLHVLKFRSQPFAGNAKIQVCINEKSYTLELERYVEKNGTDVISGTGDQIYTDLTYGSTEDYLVWYLHNRLGKMLTFRTTYRWSGADCVDDGVYDWAIKLLADYGVKSAIMTEGRELPNIETNGKHYFQNDPSFLGYQTHEHDGMFLYWGGRECQKERLYHELIIRLFQAEGCSATPNIGLTKAGNRCYRYYDPNRAQNMQQAAETFVRNIAAIRQDATRHSGPSILFKYFFEAGVKWCCAELMYNPLEVITAALRGASLANGQHSYGGHMAVQWSTTPHDNIYRYRRFFNGLITAYTNGIDQINTEEGCWRLEECYGDFERNSSACLHHTSVQAALSDFVATHTRRGALKTNIAVLQGKYDGLDMFTHSDFPVWGMTGIEKGDSEKSWDFIKVFFPAVQLACIYLHECPQEPVGFHTGTPYGLVDIIPDDSATEFMARYQYMIMLGYHCTDHSFNTRVLDYVRNGGVLLATLAHFTNCTDHETVNAGQGRVLYDESLRKLMGHLDMIDTPDGQRLADSSGKVPPIVCRKVGKGKVILFNTTVYPNHASIRDKYQETMEALAQENAENEKCRGWVETKDWVSTSIFDAEDRRTIYCVNVNWWSDEEPLETVTLHNDGFAYELAVARDTVCIASIFGETMFVAQSMTLDVLGFDGKTLRVQGKQGDAVSVYSKGKTHDIVLPADGIYETIV